MKLATGFCAFCCLLLLPGQSTQSRPGDRVERHPFTVGTAFDAVEYDPAVASDKDGSFVVVWQDGVYLETRRGIWARRYDDDGVPRGEQFRVSPESADSTTRASHAAIAMDADGDYVVIWSARYGTNETEVIQGQRFTSTDQPAGKVFTVSAPDQFPLTGVGAPRVAMNADGAFVVVWRALVPGADQVRAYARRYDASGRPRAGALRLNPTDASSLRTWDIGVAIDDTGGFVAVWNQSVDDRAPVVRGKRFDAQGTPGRPFLVAASTDAVNVGGEIEIAMDAEGAFVVFFGRYGPSGSPGEIIGLFARRFDALAIPQGAPLRVSPVGGPAWGDLSADMDDDGDFVAAWATDHEAEGNRIHVRFFDASGAAITTARQYDFDGRYPRYVKLAMDAIGNVVSVWTRTASTNEWGNPGTMGQRFAGPDDARDGCLGFLATIAGTASSDIVAGTDADDVIQGLGGSDVLNGGTGADVLCGGAGDDQLYGDPGDDHLSGGTGDDVLDGGSGHDLCDGGRQFNADIGIECETLMRIP